jgi:hypothetical protein
MSGAITFNGSKVQTGGANILNIANGTNAQSLRVYNTDDGAGNAEYGIARLVNKRTFCIIGTPSRPALGLSDSLYSTAVRRKFSGRGHRLVCDQ